MERKIDLIEEENCYVLWVYKNAKNSENSEESKEKQNPELKIYFSCTGRTKKEALKEAEEFKEEMSNPNLESKIP